MKKCVFYSLVQSSNKLIAQQWQGWTDGKYNYYKNGGMWFCIEPNCGLSIAAGETRAMAKE